MSVVKFINSNYLKGPKGDRGPKGDSGTGFSSTSGRITYNPATKIIGFNETGLATEAYVNNSISAIVNNAPAVLDTLNELAAAIGNNANFITDISANINSKLSLSGGTMTGPITLAADPVNSLHAVTKNYVDSLINDVEITNSDNVPEGSTNLYFTTSRARSSINVSGSLNYNPSTGVISYTAPVLATVATSGSYNDLLNKPTTISTFTNDAGYLTTVSWEQVTGRPTLSTVATSGSFNDLTDVPAEIITGTSTIDGGTF